MLKKIFLALREKLSGVSEKQTETSSHSLFIGILVTFVLSAIAFVPLFGLNGLLVRNLVVPILAGAVLIIIAVQSLKQGYFVLVDKKSPWLLLGFSGLLLITSLFAVSSRNALFGGFDAAPSFISLFSLVIFLYAASISLKKFSRIFGLLMTVSFVYVVVFIHQIVRIVFGPSVLSFGFLNSTTSSLLGSWIDFSVFSLLIVVFAVICLEIGKFVRTAKWVALTVGIFGLIGLFLTNISWVWVLAGAILIVTSIYLFSFAYWNPEKLSYDRGRVIPWYSISAFVIVMIGILFGNFITSFISQVRPITYNEVAPTVTATFRAGVNNIKEKPLFGTGLGSYDAAWNKIKPISFSGSEIGSAEFSQGDSFVGAHIATTGIVGIIAWLLFVVFLGNIYYRLLKNGFWNSADRFSSTLVMTGSLLFTFVAFIYYPSASVLILWVLFVGALWGIVHEKEHKISFIDDPRTSFFGILAVLLIILIGGIMSYMSTRKVISAFNYSSALQSFAVNDLQNGVQKLVRANSAWFTDFYNRALANQVLTEVRSLPAPSQENQDALAREVQRVLSTGLSFADSATRLDPGNYRNWVVLGNVYQLFTNLGVEGALERTQESYDKAASLSPNDRTLDILFANLLASQGKMADAEAKVTESLNTWPTTDGFLWMYQRNISQEKYVAAEQNLINAYQTNTANYSVATELGLLYFNQGKYAQAIPAFQQSLLINRFQPAVFAYLGVTYERAGQTAAAQEVYDFLRRELPEQADTLISQVKGVRVNNQTPTTTPVVEQSNESTEQESSEQE